MHDKPIQRRQSRFAPAECHVDPTVDARQPMRLAVQQPPDLVGRRQHEAT